MDVPAKEPDLSPVPRDDAGELTTPTPAKDEALTETECELLKTAAELAALAGSKMSGAANE